MLMTHLSLHLHFPSQSLFINFTCKFVPNGQYNFTKVVPQTTNSHFFLNIANRGIHVEKRENK